MRILHFLTRIVLGLSVFFLAYPAWASSLLVSTDTGGSVGYSYRDSQYSTGTEEVKNLFQVDLHNRFYIWQDWFMNGNANLVVTQDQGATQNGKRESQTVTGAAGLNVLPQSRAPLSLNISRSDSRLNNDLPIDSTTSAPILNDQLVTDYATVTQSLIGDRHRVQLRYITNQQTSNLRGAFGSDTYEIDGIVRGSGQDLTFNFRTKDEESYDQTDRQIQSVNIRHGFYASEQINWNTQFSSSVSSQQINQPTETEAFDYKMGLEQINSNFMWRSLDRKTNLTAGVRYFSVDLESSYSTNENASLNGSLGVMHRFTPNLTGNVSVNRTEGLKRTGVTAPSLAQDKMGLSYRSDQINLDRYRYSWQAATELNQRRDEDLTQNEANLSLGHSVFRDWHLDRFNRINMRASQDIFLNATDNDELDYSNRQRIGHRFVTGWNRSLNATSQSVQLSFSDRRDLEQNNIMQMFAAEYTQKTHLTQKASVNTNINFQVNRYEYAENDITSSENTLKSANFYFNYISPFSVPGLIFRSDLKYIESETDYDDELAKEFGWKNQLTYRVGKLDASLQHNQREVRKIQYSFLFFNIKRVF